ncbi:MAG: ATPase [Treponema sp.]|jgi:sugar (pentulose or hexulose) kinase|nr:ATPase [Treponema sp.]
MGKTFLGIELGSTRIKATLIDEKYKPVASGIYGWENRFEDEVWTYRLNDVWTGLKACLRDLQQDAESRGVSCNEVSAAGVSAMMHGYLAFDKNGNLLVPFRTWRNTSCEKAAKALTETFDFNIPQRWSIAHLYQAILNGEAHVKEAAFLTTLAGYVHWKLTGQKVIGIGDASGMFPIDDKTNDYDSEMMERFNTLVKGENLGWKLRDVLPKVLLAGENAGPLIDECPLDVAGVLRAGLPFCPPEGDAGTGMIATNSIMERTGNISAGTSVFAMITLEKPLSRVYREIDIVTTPEGKPVAMVHCNNCSSDIDAWFKLFRETSALLGVQYDKPVLYDILYNEALKGDPDCGSLTSINYHSGEPITGFEKGRPLFVRSSDSRFTTANFVRSLLFSAMATLKFGMDILIGEKVRVDVLTGHGGLFKTKNVGQRLMAGALNTSIAIMEGAGEGGSWGCALLAAFMAQKQTDETLSAFLEDKVFVDIEGAVVDPDPKDVQGFVEFMSRYIACLEIERTVVKVLE